MRKRTNQIIVRLSDQEMLLLRRKLRESQWHDYDRVFSQLTDRERRNQNLCRLSLMQDVQRQVRRCWS